MVEGLVEALSSETALDLDDGMDVVGDPDDIFRSHLEQ
jgi:hypothetical protein